VHELPQAVPAAAGAASWEAETQTADSTTAKVTASSIFLIIVQFSFLVYFLSEALSLAAPDRCETIKIHSKKNRPLSPGRFSFSESRNHQRTKTE
jgi:hypothetical protein